jgi:phenylalanyl-tRNA synthetase beta chain
MWLAWTDFERDHMKVTINWLKQYVDFSWSPEEMTERLTMLGMEVEGVHKIGGEFEGVVVAQVITRDKHPNADKLSICRVNDGKGERQIVCGAQNFKAGDKVPLILPGATLPPKPGEPPFTIKVGKIRGVESHGMMCSPEELGLPEKIDGLYILREDATVGQPFAEYLGRASGDVLFDLEITPNRPDLNSVIGIAREISALTGNPLRIPHAEIPADRMASGNIETFVSVRVEDAELCPRYTARLIRGVKIGPSPDWLRQTLEKVGLRSINNVVDVTNFVMLEVGQPLHAFDFHLLTAQPGKTPVIVVRRAAEGEAFVTLDGGKHTLTDKMLLIADETKGVALAGIMGGLNSEINNQTADVLIESAYFKPQSIRVTSKKLDLRSDSSYRFERGGDVGICEYASRRAVRLICELAGGTVLDTYVDAYPKPADKKKITLRFAKVGELLGAEVPAEQSVAFLKNLGLDVAEAGAEACVVTIPTHRVDLKREVDLIEEIARLFGVNKIPSTAPRGALGTNAFDGVYDQLSEARRIFVGLGCSEAQGQTLISESAANLALPAGAQIVALKYPLSSDMNVLRPSLLPCLLEALRHNISHKNPDVAIFETGRVFSLTRGQVREERRLGVALTGRRDSTFWSGSERGALCDIYDLKGILEEFFEQYGVRGMTYVRRESSTPLFLESAQIQLGKNVIGELGQLSPALARQYDLRDAALLAELNLDLILARRSPTKSFKAIPAFPAIRRDLALLVPENTTHEAILAAVKQAKPLFLESVELFDVFRGKNVPAGQKSVAYAFTYRNLEKTLTDAEVNASQEKLVAHLKQALAAVIRES